MFGSRRLSIALALAVAVTVPGVRAVSARQERPTPTVSYTVRQGDTLWQIAARAGLEGDRRAAVQRILDLNDLHGAALRPGQRLRLPLR